MRPILARHSRGPAREVIWQTTTSPPAITLVAVDPALFPGAERKLGTAAMQRYHAANFEHLLQPARKLLATAGLPVEEQALVGEIAPTLVTLAKQGRSWARCPQRYSRTAPCR
ncbi:MAG: hypothetical protein M3485_01230 [Pseudomonadota bacterium]|nr:hypothetical protein [Pseudomonadota bacterium]